MIDWTRTPPPESIRQTLTLIRVPSAQPLNAIITSTDLIGCWTHFYRGRTTPCEKDTCNACKDGLSARWHSYFTIYRPDRSFHQILELTAAASQYLIQYRKAQGTLRGCSFSAWRPSRTPNGRIVIRCKPTDLQKIRLPQPPDLIKQLLTIWGYPQADAQIDRPHTIDKTLELRGNLTQHIHSTLHTNPPNGRPQLEPPQPPTQPNKPQE